MPRMIRTSQRSARYRQCQVPWFIAHPIVPQMDRAELAARISPALDCPTRVKQACATMPTCRHPLKTQDQLETLKS